MGLLLRPRSAWGACGAAALGASRMSRRRCVRLMLQTYLLSSKASGEHLKGGFPITSISVLVFPQPILITESATKIAAALTLFLYIS